MKHIYTSILVSAALFLTGCGADSLLPWLDDTSLIPCNHDWLGEWYLNMDSDEGDLRFVVELQNKFTVFNGEVIPEKYHIFVFNKEGERKASLIAHLHNVNGVQLIQVEHFTRPLSEKIATFETYSLWQIAGNADNLIIWVPEFVIDIRINNQEPPVKMFRAGDETEQPLFVDTTQNLQAFIKRWSMTYQESELKAAIKLHRKDKEFEMPEGVKEKKPNKRLQSTPH